MSLTGLLPILLPVAGLFVAGWVIRTIVWARVTAGDGTLGTIEGYVGKPGQGKTTLAVQDCIGRARLLNAYLVSNVPILADGVESMTIRVNEEGLDVEWLVHLALRARREGRSIVLFLDEVGVWMPARLWQQFGIALMWLLQQSRKLYVEMRWTAQSATFVDTQLRELTAGVHLVHAVPPATVGRRLRGKRPWWINVHTYDSAERVGSADALVGQQTGLFGGVRYQRWWEATFDTDAMVLPPAKLKGAEALLEAIRRAIAEGDYDGHPLMPTLQEAETVLRGG